MKAKGNDWGSEIKVIYTAGAYRSNKGEWQVRQNIRRAEKAAETIWQMGGAAICPHKNTAGFGGLPGCEDDEIWLRGDLEIIMRCDALFMVEGWENSSGALRERELAISLGMPILYNQMEVYEYLKGETEQDKA